MEKINPEQSKQNFIPESEKQLKDKLEESNIVPVSNQEAEEIQKRDVELQRVRNKIAIDKEKKSTDTPLLGQTEIGKFQGFILQEKAEQFIKEGELEKASKDYEGAAREFEVDGFSEEAKGAWKEFSKIRYQLGDKHGGLVGLRNAGHKGAILTWRLKVFLENLFK